MNFMHQRPNPLVFLTSEAVNGRLEGRHGSSLLHLNKDDVDRLPFRRIIEVGHLDWLCRPVVKRFVEAKLVVLPLDRKPCYLVEAAFHTAVGFGWSLAKSTSRCPT